MVVFPAPLGALKMISFPLTSGIMI